MNTPGTNHSKFTARTAISLEPKILPQIHIQIIYNGICMSEPLVFTISCHQPGNVHCSLFSAVLTSSIHRLWLLIAKKPINRIPPMKNHIRRSAFRSVDSGFISGFR